MVNAKFKGENSPLVQEACLISEEMCDFVQFSLAQTYYEEMCIGEIS
jgi:hypothetical protein